MTFEMLKARAAIVRGIRRFFDERGFTEVETPVRIAAPAPEPHIDCPPVTTGGFLRASPELEMKMLLANGADKIYQIGPCFRDGEKGSRHNPEFTMIEWYRLSATYLDILSDTRDLIASLVSHLPVFSPSHPLTFSPSHPLTFNSLRVRDAYARYAGWDPWENWDQDRFDFDMATKIEPALADLGLVFLMDYPPECASLARVSEGAGDGRGQSPEKFFAERWELYWDGLELANAFTELCDSAEQRRRFEAAKAERKTLKESDYPINYQFIDSLNAIPAAAGVALGVDRLIMKLTGAKEILDIRAI